MAAVRDREKKGFACKKKVDPISGRRKFEIVRNFFEWSLNKLAEKVVFCFHVFPVQSHERIKISVNILDEILNLRNKQTSLTK